MQTIVCFLVTVLFAITRVHAANNWAEPCISGVCHYDLDSSDGQTSGTVKLWGSHKAISDITPAAGWYILECDEDPMEQMIRMVCVSQELPCSHLFSYGGPEDKIVRLPKRCGKNPFARVVSVGISHDQSLPPRLARRLQKRDGRFPIVYNVAFNTDFSTVDPKHGPINFAFQAANIPNVDPNIDTHFRFEKRSGRPVQRSHEDIVARSLSSVRESIQSHLKNADKKIKEGAENVHDRVKKVVEEAEVPFHKHKTFTFSPKLGNRNITLFKKTINCPPIYPGVEVDLNPQGSAHVTVGVSISGTIIPPRIIGFSTVTRMTVDIDATLLVDADVYILFDSGANPIAKFPIEALEIPGIISLGPELRLLVQARLSFDIMIGTRIQIGYHVKDVEIIFPKKKDVEPGHPDVGFDKGGLKLSSTPFVRGMAQAEFHIIPTVWVGLDAFGKATSGFNIMADTLILFRVISEYNAKTRPIKTRAFDDMNLFDGGRVVGELPLSSKSMEEMALSYGHGRNTANVMAANEYYKREALPVAPKPGLSGWAGGIGPLPNVDTTKSSAINLCFEILFIVDISVGANAVFLHFFDENTRYSFYRQVWKIFMYCIGTSQPKGGYLVNNLDNWLKDPLIAPRSENMSPRPMTSLIKRGLRIKCLSTTTSVAQILGTTNLDLSRTKPLH